MARTIGYREIPVSELELNGENVRATKGPIDELENSIIEHGILQPLIVRQKENGKLTVVAGGRRLAAAKSLGLETVPAIVKELTDREAFVISLSENIQRESLEPYDEWAGVARLSRVEGTQAAAAKTLGKSEKWVSERVQAYRFVREMRERSLSHARVTIPRDPTKVREIKSTAEVLFPEDPDKQAELYETLVDRPREEIRRILGEMKVRYEENPNLFEVKSIEEVVKSILIVVNLHVELTFSAALSKGIMRVAEERGISYEDVVRMAVQDYLKRGGYLG